MSWIPIQSLLSRGFTEIKCGASIFLTVASATSYIMSDRLTMIRLLPPVMNKKESNHARELF